MWNTAFRRLLRKKDARWDGLLEAVEQLKGRPVVAADETQWWTALKLGPDPM